LKTNITHSCSSSDLAQGQHWQLTNSHIEIGFVGKTLVHYKHFKANAKTKRADNSLTSIRVLKQYLRDNEAVLGAK
jgi:hypothetical protein